MPIFEYKCEDCGHKFEKLILNNSKIECPNCKSTNLKKLISTFSSPNTPSGSSCSSCSSTSCSGCGFSNG